MGSVTDSGFCVASSLKFTIARIATPDFPPKQGYRSPERLPQRLPPNSHGGQNASAHFAKAAAIIIALALAGSR